MYVIYRYMNTYIIYIILLFVYYLRYWYFLYDLKKRKNVLCCSHIDTVLLQKNISHREYFYDTFIVFLYPRAPWQPPDPSRMENSSMNVLSSIFYAPHKKIIICVSNYKKVGKWQNYAF